jgi:hypothetical protein
MSLTAFLVAAAALSAAAQEGDHFQSEPFGAPSGPGVFRTLGLILEHVPESGGPGSLRLFGGVPGEPAAVRIGTTLAAEPGPDATTNLVGSGALVIRGTFDSTGAFAVRLADLPRELLASGAYAQGIQAGELAWGPIPREGFAMSQGLHLERVPAALPVANPLAHIGSRLPESRRAELDAALASSDLVAFLSTALDSDGDEVGVKLDGDLQATIAPGVSLGGKAAFEAVVARESASSYSVSVKREAAVLANVGAGDFAGVEGARGLGSRVIFTFPSANGAARGIFGLWLAQRIPLGTSLPELPDRRPLEQAELAWTAARAQVAVAAARVCAARVSVARAGSGECGPFALLAKAAAMNVLAAVQAVLNGVQQVETRAFGALQSARAQFESALSCFWMVQRLLFEVDGARRYALLHAAGQELTFNTTAEFKLSLLGSVVTIQGNDLGFKSGIERAVAVRIGKLVAGSAVPVEVTLRRKKALEAWAGVVVGGRASLERAIVGRVGFEMGPGASSARTEEVAVEADAWARYEESVGLRQGLPIQGITSTSGIGRKVAFSVPLDELASALGAIDGQGAGLAALATMQGDMDLCDYRVEGYVARYGINAGGTGGSIGLQMLVKDSGEALAIDGASGRRALGTITSALENWIAPQP